MALHLNLNHELQKQLRARKRDPLRLGMYGLGVVVLAFVGYYFSRVSQVSQTTSRLAEVEAKWRDVEPKKKAAETRATELKANVQLSDSLVRQIEERFYWGPVLERVMQAVPSEVQLTRFEATRAPEKTKNISLVVNGISTGPEPRKTAEETRRALEQKLTTDNLKATSSFKLLEEGEQKAVLNGRTLPTANFTIELELVRNDPAPTAATKREPKK